jgi:hypothetical protein
MTLRSRDLQLFPPKLSQGESGFLYILVSFLCFFNSCGPHDKPTAAAEENAAVTMIVDEDIKGSSTITGRIFFEGALPPPELIKMDKDPACCPAGALPVYSEEVAINPDNTLRNVFIYIKHGLTPRQFTTPASPVILDQRGCRYEPRVFGIQVGQPLRILNSDRTFHNVHASAQKNKAFNLAMSAVMKVRERSFDHPEIMIPIRCNVHSWMIAYAGVLDHPFYAVTGAQGNFTLRSLPGGEYMLEAWHEKLGTLSQNVKLGESETKTVDFIFQTR